MAPHRGLHGETFPQPTHSWVRSGAPTQIFLKILLPLKIDGPVKSLVMLFSVIPAKAGIQSSQIVINYLDSGFHRSDGFLRSHQRLIRNCLIMHNANSRR
jgi:hypothetical protein